MASETCQCADPKCRNEINHKSSPLCNRYGTVVVLYRIDMEDAGGTAFCDECAEDALDSGLFTK